MTSMFTIPGNTLLVFALVIILSIIGFVIYGFIKGWKNIMPEYDIIKKQLSIED